MEQTSQIEIDLLTRQLARMRAMQYAYNRKFFVLLLLSVVAITLAFASATVGGWVLLAFALVTSGVTASFFLHFSDFARTHARAIEMRINKLLGRRVLLASEIEADYFYPHESSKLSGFVPDRPDTFFSMFTLHFTFVWAAAIVTAWWNVLGEIGVWRALPALAVFTAWTALNVAFLLRWFSGDAERRIANTLRDAYDLEGEL